MLRAESLQNLLKVSLIRKCIECNITQAFYSVHWLRNLIIILMLKMFDEPNVLGNSKMPDYSTNAQLGRGRSMAR